MSCRSLEWSSDFHEALRIRKLHYMPDGPIIAKAEVCEDTNAIFVVRPDARTGIRYDFKKDLRNALGDYGIGPES